MPNWIPKGSLLGRRVNQNADSQLGTESLGLFPACSGPLGMAWLVLGPNQRSRSPEPVCTALANSCVISLGRAGWPMPCPVNKQGRVFWTRPLKLPD